MERYQSGDSPNDLSVRLELHGARISGEMIPLGDYAANLVGPAFTLRNIPAREDLDRVEGFANPEHPQRKAIEAIRQLDR